MTRDEEDDNIWSLEDDEWKFTIERLTSSNFIIKFDADEALEGSDFIRFFWERLSSGSDGTTRMGTRQLGRISQKDNW